MEIGRNSASFHRSHTEVISLGNTFKLLDLCLDAKDSFKRAYTQIIHSSCDSLNSKVYLIVLVHVKSKKRLLMVIRSASESCNHSNCGAVR